MKKCRIKDCGQKYRGSVIGLQHDVITHFTIETAKGAVIKTSLFSGLVPTPTEL